MYTYISECVCVICPLFCLKHVVYNTECKLCQLILSVRRSTPINSLTGMVCMVPKIAKCASRHGALHFLAADSALLMGFILLIPPC